MAIDAVNQKPISSSTSLSALSAVQKHRNQRNIALLQSSIPTISLINTPMALVLRTTIENLNEELISDLGPHSIQRGFDSGQAVNPESTAQRIVKQATGYYSVYRTQHTDQTDEQALSQFMDTISKGIDKGFSEAGTLLKGLNVLSKETSNNIEQTYVFVQEKLQIFEQSIRFAKTGDP